MRCYLFYHLQATVTKRRKGSSCCPPAGRLQADAAAHTQPDAEQMHDTQSHQATSGAALSSGCTLRTHRRTGSSASAAADDASSLLQPVMEGRWAGCSDAPGAAGVGAGAAALTELLVSPADTAGTSSGTWQAGAAATAVATGTVAEMSAISSESAHQHPLDLHQGPWLSSVHQQPGLQLCQQGLPDMQQMIQQAVQQALQQAVLSVGAAGQSPLQQALQQAVQHTVQQAVQQALAQQAGSLAGACASAAPYCIVDANQQSVAPIPGLQGASDHVQAPAGLQLAWQQGPDALVQQPLWPSHCCAMGQAQQPQQLHVDSLQHLEAPEANKRHHVTGGLQPSATAAGSCVVQPPGVVAQSEEDQHHAGGVQIMLAGSQARHVIQYGQQQTLMQLLPVAPGSPCGLAGTAAAPSANTKVHLPTAPSTTAVQHSHVAQEQQQQLMLQHRMAVRETAGMVQHSPCVHDDLGPAAGGAACIALATESASGYCCLDSMNAISAIGVDGKPPAILLGTGVTERPSPVVECLLSPVSMCLRGFVEGSALVNQDDGLCLDGLVCSLV